MGSLHGETELRKVTHTQARHNPKTPILLELKPAASMRMIAARTQGL